MPNKIIKSFFCLVLLSLISFSFLSCNADKNNKTEIPTNEQSTQTEIDKTENTSTETINWEGPDDKISAQGAGLENAIVIFHYQRKKADYKNWGMWVWKSNGVRIEIANKDDFGVYYKINLGDKTKDYYHATTLNYIYYLSKSGGWDMKDTVSKDRNVVLLSSMLNEKNEINLYSFEGVEDIFLDKEKKNPICFIKTVALSNEANAINVETNVKGDTYELYNNNELVDSGQIKGATFNIPITSFDLNNDDYFVKVIFSNDFTQEKSLNINTYFDTKDFVSNYTYDGKDLGVTVANDKTTFKLWAPISSEVSVQLYNYGHPTNYGTKDYPGDDTPYKTLNMVKEEKGVWSVTVDEDLSNKYYTYSVKNGSTITKDIVDPYAKATGINGLRGYIVNFSKTNPAGWKYDYKRPYTANELIVYELHVRDLTMDDTWQGTEANRGKYLGLCEDNTSYTANNTTVTTGFAHIKELGVNAVQILPFFDQANDERKNEFNWGYNPQNYNVLEGSYSSNPYDAETRITEFKQMVMAYQNAGIEIIMDVVYNHMNSIGDSSFDKIVPGYFFRYTEDGMASNGSGCGNETASDRIMYQKYMIDSTEFWAKEYNLSGFRFDLMGLHDYKTMNKLSANLKSIDKNIVVYGEPWDGGTTTLSQDLQAKTSNVDKLEGVAIFNDQIRDAIKGSVFHQKSGAWVQSSGPKGLVTNSLNGLLYGEPTKQINYVSCHDNNTLRDKLLLSCVDEADIPYADIVAQGLVLTSEGISFMQAGEEILRSKPIFDEDGNQLPILDEDGEVIGISSNSYNLPDNTNSIKWDEKITNITVFNKYKELIKINREHILFQYDTSARCSNYKVEKYDNNFASDNVITARVNITDVLANKDTWKSAMIICTNKNGSIDAKYSSLDGQWKVGFVSGNTDIKVNDSITKDTTIKCGNYTMIILYQLAD